jgi:beta-phosphoglucomutase-like phosphatase (HAD superfamily)
MLKVAPEAICVIEDAEAGVEAALAAGMTVIGITNSSPERLRASKSAKPTQNGAPSLGPGERELLPLRVGL